MLADISQKALQALVWQVLVYFLHMLSVYPLHGHKQCYEMSIDENYIFQSPACTFPSSESKDFAPFTAMLSIHLDPPSILL